MRLFTHAIAFGRIIVVTQRTHRHVRSVTIALDEQYNRNHLEDKSAPRGESGIFLGPSCEL